MTNRMPATNPSFTPFPKEEWIKPPSGIVDGLSFQPIRVVPKRLRRADMELREKFLERGALVVTPDGKAKIGKLGEKEDIVLPIDLRTGIITTDENPLRIDDITLAFLRKKANWKDKEVNHEVSLPPGARR